jgi:DNA-binding MarR family transcriptional regulator
MADPVVTARHDEALPAARRDDLVTLVELLFFAYRDFTAEADAILAEFGLFRAHHRALHFVRRHPGLRLQDLLSILKITKQSLGRVVTDLAAQGLLDSEPDPADRRARRLIITPKGNALAERLVQRQTALIAAALATSTAAPGATIGPVREADVRRFLYALVADTERPYVADLLAERQT